ncbi:MAG: PEGA domain-containing protein [Candidatus Edwardsbacteria bacterium]|nr:PEGA domain-containing protein [Candidatus Edwardsbacteria bacterium]
MLNRSLLIFVTLLMTLGTAYGQEGKPAIAILPFEGRNISADEAMTLSDRIRAELTDAGVYSVMERSEMEKVLKEQAFQLTGACSEASCIRKIGQLIAVTRMVGGSISKIGGIYTIEARLINVETGAIEKSVTEDFGGTVEVLLTKIMGKVARRLSGVTETQQRSLFGGDADLFVKSDPAGGTIYIDDQPVGQVTPGMVKKLVPGSHTVRVETADMEKDTTVAVDAKAVKTLQLTLVKKLRKLRVYSDPPEAAVYLDNALAGNTPYEGEIKQDGKLIVAIKKDGFATEVETLLVAGPKLYAVEKALSAAGILTVRSRPAGAEVYVDGRRVGLTDLTTREVGVGDHKLVLRLFGYYDVERTVNLREKLEMVFDTVLAQRRATLAVAGSPSGAKVLLDGAPVGAVPLRQVPLSFGSHSVVIKAAGYHPVQQELNVANEEQRQLKIDLQRKSPLRAGLYSLLLPGLGQRYSDRGGLGYVYMAASLAAAGTAAYAVINHSGTVKDYDQALSDYQGAGTTADAAARFTTMNQRYSDYQSSLSLLKTSIIAAAAAWGLNVLDAVILFPGAPKVSAAPDTKTGGLEGSLGLTFNW